ncbi:MAG: cytochrome c3 family protein [Thermodesulfobacteriota bacterium]|nr:cytochrome c3 family protein [Thermodesulfobacteriota bacterium]
MVSNPAPRATLRIPLQGITILSATLVIFLILSIPVTSLAAITGPCVNCHTMHNSQNGTAVVAGGPYASLLVGDCVGCHSAAGQATGINAVTGAPIVYNTSGAPTYGAGNQGLAGGNFYWVAQGDDTKGHNVFAANPDDNLSVAPGAVTSSCGAQCCHNNLDGTNTMFGTRQGCTKCHMMGNAAGPKGYHHKDDTGPIVDSADEGWYRFLDGHMSGAGSGVSGIEDSNWQYTSAANDHNEYLGYSGTKDSAANFSALGNTMTGFCCGCHGNFHIEQSGSVWQRHPSDAVIPNSGEYATAFDAAGGVGTYAPNVPVARPSLAGWTEASANVTLGTDLVMCLSCHKPHGSPYSDMLRWDYSEMIAGDDSKSGGCFTCHTQKND